MCRREDFDQTAWRSQPISLFSVDPCLQVLFHVTTLKYTNFLKERKYSSRININLWTRKILKLICQTNKRKKNQRLNFMQHFYNCLQYLIYKMTFKSLTEVFGLTRQTSSNVNLDQTAPLQLSG